jgi:hypothetical protein
MRIKLQFLQGVETIGNGTYVRPISIFDGGGLFVMNVDTGEWTRRFKGFEAYTVNFDGTDEIVGVSQDEGGNFAYRANLTTNTVTKIGYLPALTSSHYSWAQGDYDFDPEANVLYLRGSKNGNLGFITFDFDTKAQSFLADDVPYLFNLVGGEPHGSDIPGQYSYMQGVSAYDSVHERVYAPGWFDPGYGEPGNDGEGSQYGLLKLRLSGEHFQVVKFVPVDIKYFISDLVFDTESGRFFAERQVSDTRIEMFAIETDGTIFTLGGAVANDFEGDHRDDYFMAQGGNDVLFGDLGDDELEGGVGNDTIRGGEGNDVVEGQSGNDKIAGGAGDDVVQGAGGKDIMAGGRGDDSFGFDLGNDSAVGTARDQITDFVRGHDQIDLATIDAKIGSGNQTFSWIGKETFNNTKGELRYDDLGKDVVVQADTNGDGEADLEIFVGGVGKLGGGDFIL